MKLNTEFYFKYNGTKYKIRATNQNEVSISVWSTLNSCLGDWKIFKIQPIPELSKKCRMAVLAELCNLNLIK